MCRRYGIVALMVCLCLFAYDTSGIFGNYGGGEAWAEVVEVDLNSTNFTDENFLKALLVALGKEENATDQKIDVEKITGLAFTAEGKITATMSDGESPFTGTTDYSAKVKAIANLKGIEKFTALTTLDVTGCTALTTLDVSGLTSLATLTVTGLSTLKTLDISGCTGLVESTTVKSGILLTGLTSLNASNMGTSLTTLDVSSITGLTTLDVSGNTGLTTLTLPNTVTTLDVSECTALTTLDVSSLTNLTNLTYSDSTSITGTFPTIYAKQVILDGSINMAFYVKGAKLSQMQAGSAKFTVSGVEKNGKFCGDSYAETDKTDTNTKYYAFSGDITSVQMADSITAAITVDGKTVTFTGYTVENYLNTITSGSYTDNEKALANALKAYGYYAQQTLSETNNKYGSHESMDAPTGDYTVTADAEAKTTYTTNHAMKILDNNGTEAVTTDVPSVSYTLDLDSKTTLHVYLPGGSTLRDANGKTGINTISSQSSTYTIDSTKVKFTEGTANATSADIAFSDIAAHELADKFTIPVTIGSTGYTIQISAMSYVDSVISKSNEQLNTAAKLGDSGTYTKAEHLKQAVLALNKYYKTACTYKGLTPIDDPATTETNPD